jgi:hypothetical protein
MTKILRITIFFVLLLSFLSSVMAVDIVYFDSYNTENILDDGRIKVTKELALGNEGNNPIVPGVMHFEVYEYDGDKKVASQVENLYAHNQGERLSVSLEKKDEYTDIIVDVWNPLLPEFKFPMTITYDVLYDEKGIVFHELYFPVETTTVRVNQGKMVILIPKKYHVTYAPKADVSKDDLYTIVSWDNPDYDVMIEYSSLPLPRMPFKSSTLFWFIVIIFLSMITVYYSKKSKKRR